MQSVGNFLERLGPVFALVMFALVVSLAVILVAMSLVRLMRRERPAAA